VSAMRTCGECQWFEEVAAGQFQGKGICYYNPPRWDCATEQDDAPVVTPDRHQCSKFADVTP